MTIKLIEHITARLAGESIGSEAKKELRDVLEMLEVPPTMQKCYQCSGPAAYLFADSRCGACTRLTPEEVTGAIDPDEEQHCKECNLWNEDLSAYGRCPTCARLILGEEVSGVTEANRCSWCGDLLEDGCCYKCTDVRSTPA